MNHYNLDNPASTTKISWSESQGFGNVPTLANVGKLLA